MAKGNKEERKVLYRAVRFEIKLNAEQEQLLLGVSENLRDVWNWALEQRVQAWEAYRRQKQEGVKKPDVRLPTLFDQINLLTGLRAQDEEYGVVGTHVPRNWQEETLDTLDGAFKSFFALAKNGDRDARTPGKRAAPSWDLEAKRFYEISGRFLSGSRPVQGGRLVLAPNIFGKDMLNFPIPEYQQMQLRRGLGVKKFTLFRDEPRLERPGKYFVSLVYEIERPETLAFSSDSAVYLALGATWLGILSFNREQIVKFWRPDKHWKPEIDAVEGRLSTKATGATNRTPLTKRSRKWNRRNHARRIMNSFMARQQKQDQREVVAWLLKQGTHFVLQDMTIRGGLADATKPERTGQLGLNWSVQNTGSIGRFVAHLEEKAKEHGGIVCKYEPDLFPMPGRGAENKLPMARQLRDRFLEEIF